MKASKNFSQAFREGEPGVDGAGKTPAKKTEYTAVTMKDGRVVNFAGNRQADKSWLEDKSGIQIDFRNGESLTLLVAELSEETKLDLLLHGASQKVGDEYSGEKNPDDMFLAADSMAERLRKGEWSVARTAGDSFSGASIVIRAIVEVTGKTVEQVKTFLNGKLEAAKAKDEKLTRADLYASFRNPASKTGVVIQRLEQEERAKGSKLNADDLLAEVGA